MKLFRCLLVAPAALGLLTPITANASEVNLIDISNYSDENNSLNFVNSFENDDSNKSQLLAGGEGLMDDTSYDGGFSETTTAAFSTNFYVGAVDGGTSDADDALMATYDFQIDLNTSFTGEDSLDISIDAGISDATGTAEFGGNGGATADALVVDGVAYTFPVGDKTTIIVGDNTDGSALFTTACAYGGPTDTLDDCGNVNAGITNGGAMVGASYDFGGGWTGALGYAGDNQNVMTDEGADAYGANVAYTADNYGISLTFGAIDSADANDPQAVADYTDKFTALNGYFVPDAEGFPSISVGYEIGEDDSAVSTADQLTSFFVGLTWDEFGAGTAGIAMGTKTPTIQDTDEEYMYEAYYSYPINDGMTVTPVVFVKEFEAGNVDDETGVMVKTSFSF